MGCVGGDDRRGTVAETLVSALTRGCRGSDASLRGSLADGTADQYSDIDLLWIVPDDAFTDAIERTPSILSAACGELAWARSDPGLARSRRRRVLKVRFVDLPLFWRVDLDVRARSIAPDDSHDLDNPAARTDAWPPAASAFENAVAAVKELQRGRHQIAGGLLARGYARIGSAWDGASPSREAAVILAELSAEHDSTLKPLVDRLTALVAALGG